MPSPQRHFLLQCLQGGCGRGVWCKDLPDFPMDVGAGDWEAKRELCPGSAPAPLGWRRGGPCSRQGISHFTSFQMQSLEKAVAGQRGLCNAGTNASELLACVALPAGDGYAQNTSEAGKKPYLFPGNLDKLEPSPDQKRRVRFPNVKRQLQ